jgi:hypothetical protein
LPAGKVVLYQAGDFGRQLVGETTLTDKALDEEVELVFGEATNLTIDTEESEIRRGTRYAVTVRNANPFTVRFEIEFPSASDRRLRLPRKLIAKPGKRVWAATLPANSERTLRYDVLEPADQ